MFVVMRLLIFLLEDTSFEIRQTDIPTSRDPCYYCNNSFCTGGNISLLVEALFFSERKKAIFPLAET